MLIFPTQQEIIDGLTYEVERLKKENQELKSLISSKNNDLLSIDDVSNQRKLLIAFSEMDEIINLVEKVNENLTEIWRVVCDIEGCNETSVNQDGTLP